MRSTKRICRWLAGIALAWMVGTIPACGSMGGMKYLVDPTFATGDSIQL